MSDHCFEDLHIQRLITHLDRESLFPQACQRQCLKWCVEGSLHRTYGGPGSTTGVSASLSTPTTVAFGTYARQAENWSANDTFNDKEAWRLTNCPAPVRMRRCKWISRSARRSSGILVLVTGFKDKANSARPRSSASSCAVLRAVSDVRRVSIRTGQHRSSVLQLVPTHSRHLLGLLVQPGVSRHSSLPHHLQRDHLESQAHAAM